MKALDGKTSSSKTSKGKKKTTSSSKKKTLYAAFRYFQSEEPTDERGKVTQIQKALAALYFYPEKGAKNNGIDGMYVPKTATVVKRFQLMHGLSIDGIDGPKTKAKLELLFK